MTRDYTFASPATKDNASRILQSLGDERMPATDLAAAVGLSKPIVYKVLTWMRANHMAHISGYTSSGEMVIKAGMGRDAVRPRKRKYEPKPRTAFKIPVPDPVLAAFFGLSPTR